FFPAEDGIRDATVTGVQTCALPIYKFFIRGINSSSIVGLTVTLKLDGVLQGPYTTPVLPLGDFQAEVGVFQDVRRAEALISGSRSEERRVGKECRGACEWEQEMSRR